MADIQGLETLQLTPLDQIMPATYTRLLLGFPFTASQSSKDSLTESIQIGIDNTVNQMPLLAGQLFPQEDASYSKRSHIRYTSDFVKVALHVLDLESFPRSYSELSSAKMPLDALDNRFAPVGVFADPLSAPCPVFAIQATFIPGGVFIGVCVHHYLMDGTGYGAFLGMLAESCRTAGSFSVPELKEIQDRSPCFVGLSAAIAPKEHPEYKIVNVDENAEPQPPLTPPKLPPMKTSLFRFSASSLTALKDEVSSNLKSESQQRVPSFLSTNDCLTALIWSCVTRSRLPHLIPLDNENSRLGMAVNGRNQLSPPLPAKYLGNVNMFATCTLPISLLASPDLGSLTTIGRSIRHAIVEIDDRHIRSAISLISAQHDIKSVQYGFNSFLGPDLAVTSWEGMGVYSHDWGCGIGRPEWVRTVPSGSGFDGLAIVLPMKGGDEDGNAKRNLEVMLGLRKEDMERLEQDKIWTKYCEVIDG